MKSHGTAKRWAEMLESLIVTSKHLRAAYLCCFRLHFSLCDLEDSKSRSPLTLAFRFPALETGVRTANIVFFNDNL